MNKKRRNEDYIAGVFKGDSSTQHHNGLGKSDCFLGNSVNIELNVHVPAQFLNVPS